jgi:DNA modification methylase
LAISIRVGDALASLRAMPPESVHCVVTSPPYWCLRDYGTRPQIWGGRADCRHRWGNEGKSGQRLRNGEGSNTAKQAVAITLHPSTGAFCQRCGAWRGSLGLEPAYQLYVEHLVAVLREVRRVLRRDGTLWLNLGDCYATGAGKAKRAGGGAQGAAWQGGAETQPNRMPQAGLKPKDLVGIPWRVAFALQDDGWWLRRDNVRAKPNGMPESVRDRCTTAHEYLFLLSKSGRYFFDGEAIKEPASQPIGKASLTGQHKASAGGFTTNGTGNSTLGSNQGAATRNKRSVWTVASAPYKGAHFATFPPALIEPCILAGTSERGVCPQCAAPWVRVVEVVERAGHKPRLDEARFKCGPGRHPSSKRREIGWRPSCDCDAGDPIPALVLDPFLGAGTTALVADRLGRHCLGIELSPGYAELARARVGGPALAAAA